MPTDVVMPQMGESIAEGTIRRGSRRSATRSSAMSRCSRFRPTRSTRRFRRPAAGTLCDQDRRRRDRCEINTVVAVIAEDGDAAAAPVPSAIGRCEAGSRAGSSCRRSEKAERAEAAPPATAASSTAAGASRCISSAAAQAPVAPTS